MISFVSRARAATCTCRVASRKHILHTHIGEVRTVIVATVHTTVVVSYRCGKIKTLPPTQIACAPSPPALRQCAPPRLAHSLHRTRLRPHSAIRIRTEQVSCELLAATHTHNTLHCTCTFLHSAHSKRVMIFLDTASTTHAPRASSRFSHALRASTALYCTRIRNRERKWLHL